METASLTAKLEDLTVKNSLKVQDQSITSNWVLTQNNKRWSDAISMVIGCKETASLTLDDIVTEDSCVILQPANANVESKNEPCVININLTGGQKMSSIGVVSEASVLEFFKESEEYAGTEFAELILEDEGATVYLAQLNFSKPTAQASVKFTRTHTDSRSYMYLYGMRLVVENAKDSSSSRRQTLEEILTNSEKVNNALGKSRLTALPNVADLADYDGNFSTEIDACLRSFMEKALAGRTERPRKTRQEPPDSIVPSTNHNCVDESTKRSQIHIESYIDKKFMDMEQRLMQRIDELDKKTTEKLDAILRQVSS